MFSYSFQLWIRAIVAFIKARANIVLVVPEYKGIHYCKNWDDVMDWMHQYPHGVRIQINGVWMINQ